MTRAPEERREDRPEERQSAALLSELLCFDLYAASRSVTSVYRPLLDELGLTYPQYLVLVLLWERDQRTVREVVEALQLDYGTVSPLVKRLESRGLVERRRRADDERSVVVHLTRAGEALRRRARGIPEAIRTAMGLDEGETATLHHMLRALTVSATAYGGELPASREGPRAASG